SAIPYSVSERNSTIRTLQARGRNRHAVFLTHPRETLTYHYERNPVEPRVQHELVLEADDYGNVLKSVAVGYGRKSSDLERTKDQERQMETLVTYTENDVTDETEFDKEPDDYRTPVVWQTRTYELTGYKLTAGAATFRDSDFVSAEDNGRLTLRFKK